MIPSHLFVCLMGLGTVFIGLLCIIFLCQLMSFLCTKLNMTTTHKQIVSNHEPITSTETTASSSTTLTIPNHKQFIAALSAAIAEDLGTDVSAIRITQIRKL